MKIGNTTLIPQNVAPENARKVAIFDSNNKLICKVGLGHLAMPNVGTKKYSVGVLSDAHITMITSQFGNPEDSQADLTRAIQYLSTVAEVTCVCGDMVSFCDDGGLAKYKEIVDANKGNMTVLGITGNHEHYSKEDKVVPMTDAVIQQYTGYPLRYTVEHKGDVFIMCGSSTWNAIFDSTGIQWLYDTLEANRNKRCFLFVHCFLKGSQYCGDSTGKVNTVDMTASYKQVFISLLNHYKNVIYFHGHSHVMAQMQDYTEALAPPLPANYDFSCGVHSIHIPSLYYPRDISNGTKENLFEESQGYVMDVYENHIVLRGRDFVKGEFIPIAYYCLDTTLQTIAPNTFTDTTGVITT